MADDVIEMVETAVFGLLAGSGALIAMLAEGAQGVHNSIAPPDAQAPLVVFQTEVATDEYTQGATVALIEYDVLVKVIVRDPDPERNLAVSGVKRSRLAAQQVYAALQDKTPTIAGYGLLKLERVNVGPVFVSTEGGARFHNVAQRFRALLQPS